MKFSLTIIASISCLCISAQTDLLTSIRGTDLHESMTSIGQEVRLEGFDRLNAKESSYLMNKNNLTDNPFMAPPPYPRTIYDIKKIQSKDSPTIDSPSHIHLIADVFGGYSNFRCERVSPKSGLGFGADIGVQGEYNGFWQKIPSGIFGEFTIGYSCRGSGAYPLHCIGARLLPFGYRYKLNTEWALAGKAGVYFAYPFNGIRSYSSSFDYGISFGLGAEWKKFGLMASYEHGFSNMVSGASVKLYNQGAFLTISYKFFTFK